MYQIGRAKVRLHGTCSREQLVSATEKFIRSVDFEKRKKAYSQSTDAAGAVETRPKRVVCG